MGEPFKSSGALSAEEFDGWLTAYQVEELIDAAMGGSGFGAIMEQASEGLVRVAAETIKVSRGTEKLTAPSYSLVPRHVLTEVTSSWIWSHPVWKTNQAVIEIRSYGGHYQTTTTYKLFNIRFDPEAVRKMLPAKTRSHTTVSPPAPVAVKPAPSQPMPVAKPEPVAPPASRAGRPRKEFWDDLIVATCRAIWLGDLKPQTQADVERWMLQWTADNTTDGVSETGVKVPAKKVFNAFRE